MCFTIFKKASRFVTDPNTRREVFVFDLMISYDTRSGFKAASSNVWKKLGNSLNPQQLSVAQKSTNFSYGRLIKLYPKYRNMIQVHLGHTCGFTRSLCLFAQPHEDAVFEAT